MAYTPSAFELTRPVDTDIAETAQLEFRTMKAFYMGTVAKFGLVNSGGTAASFTMFTTSIPAGILGTNKTIRARITGLINNTTSAVQSSAWSMAYGGTILASGILPVPGNGSFAWLIIFDITANALTNAQVIFAQDSIFDNNSSAGTGQNILFSHGSRNVGAIDSTIAQNLIFGTQNSSAVNYNIQMDKALITWQ